METQAIGPANMVYIATFSSNIESAYIDIVGHAFGRKGRVVASLFICLELYFVATGLLILEGDNLHKLLPHFDLKLGKLTVDGRHSFVVLSGVMILPTMWLNDLGILSYVSAGGVLSSIIVTVVCFLCWYDKGSWISWQGKALYSERNPYCS